MTILQRILAGYAVLVLGLAALAVVLVLHSLLVIEQSASIARCGDGILIELLQARRREKDYLLRGGLQYIHPTADQPSVSVEYHLEQLQAHVAAWKDIEADPQQEKILDEAGRYHRELLKVVQRQEKKGWENTGLIGQWRQKAAQIEGDVKEIKDLAPRLLLLDIRQREKEYLEGEHEAEAQRTRAAVRTLDRWLAAHKQDIPNADALAANLAQYLALFDQVALMDRENVLISEGFRNSAAVLELDAVRTSLNGWDRALKARERAHQQMLLIGAAALLGAVACSLWLARTIARPIHAVAQTAQKLSGGQLEARVVSRASGEVGVLIEAVNRMAESLQNTFREQQLLNVDLARRVEIEVNKVEKARSMRRFLPPDLVEAILEGREAVGDGYGRKKLTLFFSDLAGFTAFTDRHDPEDVSDVLNQYLSAMTEVAFRHGATIDKFMGDGIMIFFGAPTSQGDKEDARRCVAMALEMLQGVQTLSGRWGDLGHSLCVRIGIHSGYAAVGNFGSERRVEYTAIGGTVNLASRLETISQANAVTISHATYLLVRESFECRPLGKVSVKGIETPVEVYEVVGVRA